MRALSRTAQTRSELPQPSIPPQSRLAAPALRRPALYHHHDTRYTYLSSVEGTPFVSSAEQTSLEGLLSLRALARRHCTAAAYHHDSRHTYFVLVPRFRRSPVALRLG